MPDRNLTDLIENLRRRIADPGAYLTREHDQDDDGIRIDETIPTWSARAVAAGLEDGSLGYIPASRLADVQEELSLTTHERDLARRELGLTQLDTHNDIAHQLDTLASPGMLQMWADTCNPRPTTPEDVLRAVAEKLRRDVTAPVPGSSRRAPEPGERERVANELRAIVNDSQRMRQWEGDYAVLDRDPTSMVLSAVAEWLDREPAGEPVPTDVDPVLAEVAAELARQDSKWGQQNHPLIDPAMWARWPVRVAEEYEIPTASRAQFLCQTAAARRQVTWAHILVEEVAEFVGGGSAQSMRDELIQVAAVAVNAVKCIDRAGREEPAAPKLATGGIIRRDQAVIVGERPIDLDDRAPRPDPR